MKAALNHNLLTRGNIILCRWVSESGERKVSTRQKVSDGPPAWKEARRIRDLLMRGEEVELGCARTASSCTVRALKRLYEECKQGVSSRSRRDTLNCIRKILRYHLGFHDVDGVKVSVLNEAIDTYRRRKDLKPITINSDVQHARCMFSKECMFYYRKRGYTNLGVDYFMEIPHLKAPPPNPYVPLDIIREIDEAAKGLTGNMLMGYLLMRFYALRNREAYMLRTDDVRCEDGRYWIDPSHTKTGKRRQIPLAAEHARLFMHDGEYVLSGSASEREKSMNKGLSQWIRRFVGPETKDTCYLLRKRCEVEMRKAYGPVVAAKIMGHSITVAFNHYDHIDQLPEPLKSAC